MPSSKTMVVIFWQLLLAITLTSVTCGTYGQVSPTSESRAVEKPILAVLVPPETDPAYTVMRSFKDGILASYEEDKEKYDLRFITLSEPGRISTTLEKATDDGVMLIIGPLFKDSVEYVASMTSIPLPVLAINRPQTDHVPDLFMSIDLSMESQMEQLVQEATRSTISDDKVSLPFLILTTSSEYDQNIAKVAEQALEKKGISFQKEQVNLQEIQKIIDLNQIPFRGVIFALNSAYASLVRPYLSPELAIFGTSYTNPRNNTDEAIAQTQANDLRGMVTLEIPAVTELETSNHGKYHDHLSLLNGEDRILFAVGVDAWRLGKDWLEWHDKMEYSDGLSGKLRFDRSKSFRVTRELIPTVVQTKVQLHEQEEPDFVELEETGL